MVTSNGIPYNSILYRVPVKSEVKEQEKPKFKYEGDVPLRTQKWKDNRNVKVASKQADKFAKETVGCSFRPDLSATLKKPVRLQTVSSCSQISIIEKKDPDYFRLAPSCSKVSFASGFNMPDFMQKAKPMIQYNKIAQKK